METNSKMIVKDGQTIMLGGILFQKDTAAERKIPLLGDLPILGNAFRHTQNTVSNKEMIVFITPNVVDDEEEAFSAGVAEEVNHAKEALNEVQDHLETAVEVME